MVAHPEYLSINFLIFLVTDISLTAKMISQKSKLEKLICEATISYFDIVLEKEDEFVIENTLMFNNFFLAFITLAIKLVHHHESGELIDCILHAPMIWRFLGASRWADIPVDSSAEHNLLFVMLFYPKTLGFLEVMMANFFIHPNDVLQKFIHSKNILRYIGPICDSEILTNHLKQACKNREFYQKFREKIIAKTIIDHFLQQPHSIDVLIKLIAILPNLWEGSFASPEVVVYQSPKKTQHSSLILKFMIDAQMSGIPGMQEKVLQLLHAGTTPLFLEFNDTEWMLPMMACDARSYKYSWLMSPLFLMAKYPIYHAFLKELLITKPHLARFLKWLNQSGLIGMNALEGLLSTSALGSEIFACMMGAEDQTYQADALFPAEHLILKTNVESFCSTL